MPKPLLSIGIIFKNEIRCLERCLKSLTPLREALFCELVMADTGSDDGSREVAEKYADILFDFPWINDFAAARNAVMDRCSGRWYLTLDADEWLDDPAELITFLRSNNQKELESCAVCVRNFYTEDKTEEYSDFYATRILRLSTGIRYIGAVHEYWARPDGSRYTTITLHRTVLNHDGYIGMNEDIGKSKRLRNQKLLEGLLEKDPENTRYLLQYIESSRPDPHHMDYIYRGVAAIEAKRPGWQSYGPVIFRYAVLAAYDHKLPEQGKEWVARANELFPHSFYTTIDVAIVAFSKHWEKQEYEESIPWGEKYLAAIEDLSAGQGDQEALRISTLMFATPSWVWKTRTAMAVCYRKDGHPERSVELLADIDPMDGRVVKELLTDIQELQVSTAQDTAGHLLRLYQRITAERDESLTQERMEAFQEISHLVFDPEVREKEAAREDFHRHSYTAYLPLAGEYEIGTAAAVLETEEPEQLDKLLSTVKNWEDFPTAALLHGLEKGASFPPAGQSLTVAELDHTAKRLTLYRGPFLHMVFRRALEQCSGTWQQLLWARSLVFAAVQKFNWQDEKQGLRLSKLFSQVLEAFVSRCYMPEVLCEENLYILPPVCQFGWYSSRAFQALESGDPAGYVRLLRCGLESCPEMKVMVEFLTEHTPQLKPSPAQELVTLAEQVRALLAHYGPEDPTVVMIKQSPAYQKVAHLIEGLEAAAVGGPVQ